MRPAPAIGSQRKNEDPAINKGNNRERTRGLGSNQLKIAQEDTHENKWHSNQIEKKDPYDLERELERFLHARLLWPCYQIQPPMLMLTSGLHWPTRLRAEALRRREGALVADPVNRPVLPLRPCYLNGLSQCVARLLRILPAIQNAMDNGNLVRLHFIVDDERESFRQKPMMAEHFSMNAGVEGQRIDVSEDGVEEIIARPFALPVVEFPPGRQIPARGSQEADFHFVRLRKSALACSQSSTCFWPLSKRRCVSANSSSCQAGDSNSASFWLRSSHNASIRHNFSCRGNWAISCRLMRAIQPVFHSGVKPPHSKSLVAFDDEGGVVAAESKAVVDAGVNR
jgi:hypothetical protein